MCKDSIDDGLAFFEIPILVHKLMEGNYAAFYAFLRKLQAPLDASDAVDLADALARHGGTVRAFRALLEHSAPLKQVLNQLNINLAAENNPRILDEMLRLGVSPNRRPCEFFSPLEAAIMAGNRASVRRLMREPGLDCSLTLDLLRLWTMAEQKPEIRACWRVAARRVAGVEMPASGPVPLLKEVTLEVAAYACNWPVLLRICQERPVPVKEAVRVLKELAEPLLLELPPYKEIAPVLDAMFKSCPALLRRKYAQRMWLLCCLEPPEPSPAMLAWADKIPRRTMALWSHVSDREWYGGEGLLARWKARLGDRLLLVLNRNEMLPQNEEIADLGEAMPISQEGAEELIRTCPVRGKAPSGALSPLAVSVLRSCGVPAVLEQLDGFLAGEDPAALLAFAKEGDCPPEIRRVLLTRVKQIMKDPYLL